MLVLIGAPGSGKSTVANLLGKQLEIARLDVALEIETRLKLAATESLSCDGFACDGESAYRKCELQVVQQALAWPEPAVVALSSGAVDIPDITSWLAPHQVVWLKVSLPKLLTRKEIGPSQFAAQLNLRATLLKQLEARNKRYGQLADFTVDTDQIDAKQVLAQVFSWHTRTISTPKA